MELLDIKHLLSELIGSCRAVITAVCDNGTVAPEELPEPRLRNSEGVGGVAAVPHWRREHFIGKPIAEISIAIRPLSCGSTSSIVIGDRDGDGDGDDDDDDDDDDDSGDSDGNGAVVISIVSSCGDIEDGDDAGDNGECEGHENDVLRKARIENTFVRQ